jgi:hypothetical protein
MVRPREISMETTRGAAVSERPAFDDAAAIVLIAHSLHGAIGCAGSH